MPIYDKHSRSMIHTLLTNNKFLLIKEYHAYLIYKLNVASYPKLAKMTVIKGKIW